MLSLKCLVVFLIASSSAQHQCGRKGTPTGLIVGGTKSARNEWPWLASLFHITTQKFFCGATIISEKIVMTAAHCLQQKGSNVIKRADEVVAYLGKHNVKLAYERDVEAFYPSEVFIHPDWKVYEQKYDADLAILRSETAIKFSSKISPACLWNDNLDENVEGVVVGWGSSNATTSEYEDVPRQVKVKRISSQKCYEDFHLFAVISSPRTFCAGGVVENSGPCSGDSGGGFLVSINDVWFVNGIVSASFLTSDRHCDLSKNTVFTDLAKFKDWIDDKIEVPTTTPTILPSTNSSILNVNVCTSIDVLYDRHSDSRHYIKSLCSIAGSVSYKVAKKKCSDAGMPLFAVQDSNEQNSFVNAVRTQPKLRFKSASAWVNGERNSNGEWVSYAPDEAPLFKKLKWGDSNTLSGNWLKYEWNSGSSYFSSSNYPQPAFTFCEFKVPIL